VSFWTSSLKTFHELEGVLLSIDSELVIPGVVCCYLIALPTRIEAEIALLEPLVAGYRDAHLEALD
jgi:hypothetical protein